MDDGAAARTLHKTSGRPLHAIGNEAIMCPEKIKGQGEQVLGQVRENVFTVTVSTSSRNDPAMSEEDLVQKAALFAEHVAGISSDPKTARH